MACTIAIVVVRDDVRAMRFGSRTEPNTMRATGLARMKHRSDQRGRDGGRPDQARERRINEIMRDAATSNPSSPMTAIPPVELELIRFDATAGVSTTSLDTDCSVVSAGGTASMRAGEDSVIDERAGSVAGHADDASITEDGAAAGVGVDPLWSAAEPPSPGASLPLS